MNQPSVAGFSLSNDLLVSSSDQAFTIKKIYKYRWVMVGILSFFGLFLVFFTFLITQMAIAENRPGYFGGVALFLVFDVGMFFLVRSYIFSKEMLIVSLQEKTILIQQGRKKKYNFAFANVAQWQLRGEIVHHGRGTTVQARLYAIFNEEQAGKKYLTIFTFLPEGLFIGNGEKSRESARKKGQEVAEKLQELTRVNWRWVDYQKI